MMRRTIAVCTMTAVALTAAKADADNLFYDHTGQGVIIQNQVQVHASVNATYWCLVGNGFGYGGIQQLGGGERVFIFSFWDQNKEKTMLRAFAPDLDVQRIGRFGDNVNLEGTGFQLLFKYAWKDEVPVRAAYRAWQEPDGTHLMLSGFYLEPVTSSWRYAGTFRARTNGDSLAGTYAFTESFGGVAGHRSATFSNHWQARSDGSWQEAVSGSVLPQGSVLSAVPGGVLAESGPGITATQPDWSPLSWTTAPGNKPIPIPYRVDCGRDSVVTVDNDAEGLAHLVDAVGSFEVDGYFQGGTAASTADSVDVAAVAGAAPESVYRSWREGSSLSYSLFGLSANADYTLRMHFVEPLLASSGQRLVDVTVNGSKALASFDIFAAAGGKDRAVVRDVAVKADATGRVQVDLSTSPGSSQPALLAAIEVTTDPLLPLPDAGLGGDGSTSQDGAAGSGGSSAKDGGYSGTGGASMDGSPGSDAGQGRYATPQDDGGCACGMQRSAPRWAEAAAGLFAVLLLKRRRVRKAGALPM